MRGHEPGHGGCPSMREAIRSPALRWSALCVGSLALTLAGCGEEGDSERPDPFAAAKRRVLESHPTEPRWERVGRLQGAGKRTSSLAISRRASQWRVRWRCSSGSIELAVSSSPQASRAQSRSSCPGRGTTAFFQAGVQRLTIDSSGDWRVAVDQQLDTPLREPPLAAMRSPRARIIARGPFRPVESPGHGTALLYRLAAGRLAVRIKELRTSPAVLVIWASKARNPSTTAQLLAAPRVELGRLKSTRGDHNYLLPKALDRDSVRSVVIYSRPLRMVYTAAALN